jgi:hypothetical protein
MFSIAEATTWSADDTLAQVHARLPGGWKLTERFIPSLLIVVILDAEGIQQWAGNGVDPKLVYLDCLAWLYLRGRQAPHPAWRPREQEVPLARPNRDVAITFQDVPDLDPEEVAAVYKTSR